MAFHRVSIYWPLLCALTHLILMILQSRDLSLHLMEAEYEAQKGKVTCPRLHSEKAKSGSKAWALATGPTIQPLGTFDPSHSPFCIFICPGPLCSAKAWLKGGSWLVFPPPISDKHPWEAAWGSGRNRTLEAGPRQMH